MIPWEHLASATVPDGAEPLRLMRRGVEYSIMLGSNELMNSRLSGSEAALATLTVARLGSVRNCRTLIGGLGMGFTLRAALTVLGPDAAVIVVELVPAVIAWAQDQMAPVFGDCLADPRVTLEAGDVAGTIQAGAAQFDAILLDVDNGPDGLTRAGNDGLYDPRGLSFAHAALRPGGMLAVWSAGPDARFSQRLAAAGFAVEEVRVRANGRTRSGARHTIWLARRKA